MKGIQKKILLAGFAAIFAFIVTIGSTYAWFTTTSNNQVQPVTMNIQMQDSLLILLDDPTANSNNGYNLTDNATLLNDSTNYRTVITNADIGEYYTLANYVMTPTTTIDAVNFEGRSGTPMSGAILVSISFWVMSQSQANNIAVSELTVTADNANEEKDAVVNAIRLSVDGGEDATKIFGLDKNYDFDDDGSVIDPADAATLTAMHGVYHTTGTAVADESTNTLLSATTAFDLNADAPEKITIAIWIEGWDDDCDNNLIAAQFSIGFSFRIKK